MTPALENKLTKYLMFEDYLSRNPHAMDTYPHLKPLYEIFSQRLLLIQKTKQMLDEYGNYSTLKEELVKSAVFFCRNITSFALLEEITDLQGMFFSENTLQATCDQELLKTCQVMLSKTEGYLDDLSEYGIDAKFLTLFSDQIDRFKAAIYNDHLSEELTEQTFNEFSELINENEKIFVGKLDHIPMENT